MSMLRVVKSYHLSFSWETHADLLQEDPGDKVTKVKDTICDTARDFSNHIIGKTFTVDNTLAGKQLDEEDPQIVSLRQEILKVGEGMPHTKVEVPLKWLQVENKVYDLASKETNYITREDFKKNICDEICQFEIEDDFEMMLCERLKLKDVKESLLDIMKKFNLLCEYTSKEGSSIYLVPCMLTSKPDDEAEVGSGKPRTPTCVHHF
ncbi:hypothetical protein OS493_036760 [Desmophyllum pertusum]|uniref:Uncharacterized protein n=1 Tax=Desmophyllum pertusum TaxID=174260 RepID=A0A9W9YXW2_9CNID|nr:hypothetical protein OS493_036760 [Desmophyllum pertusum]